MRLLELSELVAGHYSDCQIDDGTRLFPQRYVGGVKEKPFVVVVQPIFRFSKSVVTDDNHIPVNTVSEA